MRQTPRTLLRLAATLTALLGTAEAQQTKPAATTRFVPAASMARFAIRDLPALLAGTQGTALGDLFAEPEVAATVQAMLTVREQRIAEWRQLIDGLEEYEPHGVSRADLVSRALYSIDWRELVTFERLAQLQEEGEDGERWRNHELVLVETTPAAEARLAAALASVAKELQTRTGGEATGDQKIGDHDAVVLPAIEDDSDSYSASHAGAWFLHLPGQFAFGTGKPAERGTCREVAAAEPGITLAMDLLRYVGMMSGVLTANDEALRALHAFGLDKAGEFSWRIHQAGKLTQSDLTLALDGKPGGLLGALLDGMAPTVDQPLPENGLLQLRCAFDVGALVTSIDELLVLGEGPSLHDLGIDEDLRRAWTGGVAFGLTAPAAGGMVPRLYLSLGIVDAEAAGRVLTKLLQLAEIPFKELKLENVACTQLQIPNAPTAFQPCYGIRDGVLHIAESGLSLRGLFKAAANGAPKALDIGEAPRPAGAGSMVPSFDLRFDTAAIYRALDEIWIPLLETTQSLSEYWRPLVQRDQMPDTDVVTKHLGKGRGVLRRGPQGLSIAMSSAVGGPEVATMLASFPTGLSGQFDSASRWQMQSLATRIAHGKATAIHAAIAAFEKRTGKRPQSLGELLAAGDLADARLLVVPGDNPAEPVLHDGKEVGRSSFRYFPAGVKVTPEDSEVTAILISLKAGYQERLVVDEHGGIHMPYNALATEPIDEIGK